MDITLKQLLIILAVFTASVLAFMGIRQLPALRSGKKNYFLSVLIIALTLIGCNFDRTSANAGEGAGLCGKENDGKDDPQRVKDLNKTQEWLGFKAFWKNLDAVEPGDTSKFMGWQPYYAGPDHNWEDANRRFDSSSKMISKIEPQLYSLVKKELLDSMEVSLLVNACQMRIEYIYSGFKSMITRMMPPPGQVEKESSIFELERRIDGLLKLKKEEKIDEGELKQAMDSINIEMKTFGLLDIVGRNRNYTYWGGYTQPGEPDSTDVFKREVAAFEKERSEFMKTYKPEKATEEEKNVFNAYERTHRELQDFSTLYPGFCDLLKDLILND
jgi:hypothetical protein